MRYSLIAAIAALSAALSAAPLQLIDKITDLEDVGVYTTGYRLLSGREATLTMGWVGPYEPSTGMCLTPMRVLGRSVTNLHEPWTSGAGIEWQNFDIKMPATGKMRLMGSVALGKDVVGKSDGVQFSIELNGKSIWSYLAKTNEWKDFDIDLSACKGQTISLKFINGPGPKNDTSFDSAMWGSRRIEASNLASLRAVPARKRNSTVVYATARANNVLPPSGTGDGTASPKLSANGAVFTLPHAATQLVFTWNPLGAEDDSAAGLLTAQEKGSQAGTIPLLSNSRLMFTREVKLIESVFESHGDRADWIRVFDAGGVKATVTTSMSVKQHSLCVSWSCDKPVVRALDGGGVMPVMYRRWIAVPYLDHSVFYLRAQDLFCSSYFDWTATNATSLPGNIATYGALTDGSRNLLRETAIITVSPHLQAVLPSTPNPPSPNIKDISKRMVLDLWGTRYAQIGELMAEQREYGINQTAAIVHAWQNMGYDNGLPLHYPANPGMGTDEELVNTVKQGVAAGARMMLHENYVDYYPNYPGFDLKHIMLNSDGTKQNAWYNEGTKIQSFAIKPDQMVPLAQTQSPIIHERYGTNGMFLDVNSSVPPSWRADMQAGVPMAGMLRHMGLQSTALWQYERDTHKGPVFGEGSNHWYWSGLLDGAEAQVATGWNVPLLVDFDLLRIHPLQSNHGMGYYSRWWDTIDPKATASMETLDRYRMQEVAFGHCGFLDSMVCGQLPFAWLEYHTMTPISEAIAGQLPTDISYLVDGKTWVDSDTAAKREQWDTVKVNYKNGVTVVANRSEKPIRWGTDTIPQYGWCVIGQNIRAISGLMTGQDGRYDDVKIPNSRFVNARHPEDWKLSSTANVQPSVASFQQTGAGKFKIQFQWKVQGRIPTDCNVLVHYTNPQAKNIENIAFQSDYTPELATRKWKVGSIVNSPDLEVSIPEGMADGDYQICVGMYSSAGRLTLVGKRDETGRCIIGTVQLRDGGKTLKMVKTDFVEEPHPVSSAVNATGRMMDFGDIKTDGSVLLRREGDRWVLRVLPTDRAVQLQLRATDWPVPVAIEGVKAKAPVKPGAVTNGWWSCSVWGGDIIAWPAK